MYNRDSQESRIQAKISWGSVTRARLFFDRRFHILAFFSSKGSLNETFCGCSVIMSGCKCSMKMSVYERTDVDDQRAVEDTGV